MARDPDADLRAMRIRRENVVNLHRNATEERKWRDAVARAEEIRKFQIQYGTLREAHARLPLGLQGDAARRLQDLSTALVSLETQYAGIPTGPSPLHALRLAARRRLN